jgi:peptidoglycan/LPS O-acetylase OafA/YrhL
MPTNAAATRPALPYYPALTGLRAVAAYLVFMHHFRPDGSPDWYERLTGQLFVGVSLFFVLSGFVIATRYQDGVQLTRPWWRRYLWRRMARIYPVYFLLNGWALYQQLFPIGPGQWANKLLLIGISQSLLRGFSNTLLYVGLPQGWSLTVEECFYVTAPLLLLWQKRWRGAPLAFVLLLLGIGLGLTALCNGRPALHGLFGSYKALFYYTFFGRVLEFVLGVLLARWWAGRPAAAVPAATHWPWRTLGGAGLLFLTVGLLYWVNSPIDFYQGPRYPAATLLNNVLFPLGAVLLLAGLLAERSWLRSALSATLAQALGRSSYFFYLLHVSVFSVWWHDTFGWDRHIGAQFVATVLLAWLGYRLLEEPLHRWLLGRRLATKTRDVRHET